MNEIIRHRDRDFLFALGRMLDDPNYDYLSLDEIACLAARQPAPFYYCSFIYALRMIRLVRRGKIAFKPGPRLRRWQELSDRCQRLVDKYGCILEDALSIVMARGGASEFFISDRLARELANRYFERRKRS